MGRSEGSIDRRRGWSWCNSTSGCDEVQGIGLEAAEGVNVPHFGSVAQKAHVKVIHDRLSVVLHPAGAGESKPGPLPIVRIVPPTLKERRKALSLLPNVRSHRFVLCFETRRANAAVQPRSP